MKNRGSTASGATVASTAIAARRAASPASATTVTAASTAAWSAVAAMPAFVTWPAAVNWLRVALAKLFHRRLARQLDAALIVDQDHLHLHLIADLHKVIHAIDILV